MKTAFRSVLVLTLLSTAIASAKTTSNVNINLGTATNFGLLAASGISNTSPDTAITGDVGSSPDPTVVGLTSDQVHGVLYTTPKPATAQAQADLAVGYDDAARATCGTDLSGMDLGGLTLGPGVYCFSSAAQLTGTLILDGHGNTNSQWVFQVAGSLTAAPDSLISMKNGGITCNVFWQVGAAATLQADSTFAGTIMAVSDINLAGGTVNGRALTKSGAITITGAETASSASCKCTIVVSSSKTGTVSNITVPLPYEDGPYVQSTIATHLASADGIACGPDKRLYIAQSGIAGGPMRIVRIDQNGQNQRTMFDFSKVPRLSSSGGPSGMTFASAEGGGQLFFSTKLSQGLPNTGVWNASQQGLFHSVLPFPANGSANSGGGATAFLTAGTYAGNLLAVDEANKKVIRVAPPFETAQAGTDFITNLSSPVGMAINLVGNVFVSNTDGTILQFSPDGTPLGIYASTGLHNVNITFDGAFLFVATQEGPVIMIRPNGSQESLGTVDGASGITVCKR